MARKRINIKFLVIGLSVVLVLGIAAGMYKFRRQLFWPAPEKLVAQAKVHMEKGEWEEARDLLYKAGQIRPNPEIHVLIGDVWNELAGQSTENLGKAAGFWQNALVIDPNYLPALQRLLDRHLEIAEESGHPNTLQSLRDQAQRMLVADPDHKEARIALYGSAIKLKMRGGQIEPSAVDEAVEGLERMLKEDPSNAEALLLIGSHKLYGAQEAYRANDDTTMNRLLDEVESLARSHTEQFPNDADLHYRAAVLYYSIGSVLRMTRGEYESWNDRGRESIARARELVKVGDEKYLEIQASYASELQRQKKFDEAEAVFRELVQHYPKNQRVRRALGTMLGRLPDRRDEAIALLSQAAPQAEELSGIRAVLAKDEEIMTLAAMLDLKLDDLSQTVDPAARQNTLKEIEADQARLTSLWGEHPKVLALKGRVQIAKGDMLGAVQSLNGALRSPERQRDEDRLEAMRFLAHAYIQTRQSGQAKRTLGEMIRMLDVPGNEPQVTAARVMLIDLLINEGNFEEARPHALALEKLLPADDPQLVIAKMAALDRRTQLEEMRQLFDKLPEETRGAVVTKFQIAVRMLDDDALASSIYERYRAKHPEDVDMVLAMANFYARQNKEEAVRVVTEALAKAPDDQRLQQAHKALTTEQTAADIDKRRQEYIDNASDPVVRELRRFEVAQELNRPEEALSYLHAAEKLKPDHPRVLTLLFGAAAAQQEWDKAVGYLDRLGKVNPDQARVLRVRYLLARGEQKDALNQAQQLTRERGDFAQSWLELGRVQHVSGNLVEAIGAYKTALERDSRNLEAMQGLMECYYRINDPAEAKRFLEMAQRVYPENPALKEVALAHEVQYGDPETAIPPRLEQLKKQESDPANWLALGQAYFAAGRAKVSANKEPEAKAHFLKAKETFESALAKWPDDQRFAGGVAEVSLRLERPEDGEKAIRSLMQQAKWKDRHEPTFMLAEFLMMANKSAEAEKVYRDLFTATKDVGIQLRLADLVFKQKGIDEALVVLSENAEQPAVRRQKIDFLVRSLRGAEAQKELEALSAGAEPTAALLELQAMVYAANNKAADAMNALNKALAMEPGYAPALYRRGYLLLYNRGDIAGAIRDLSAVRDLSPRFIEARLALADAHRANNDIQNGIRELETAVRDVPTEKLLRLKLVELYSKAVPPRWVDAERSLREAREMPQFAKDAQLMQAEAQMWVDRKDLRRAMSIIQQAAQVAPNDVGVARSFMDILIQAKDYRTVLAASDQLIKAQPNLYWVYELRGIARNRLQDKDGAVLEFNTGLQVANQQGNDRAAQALVRTMAQEVGFAAAMRRVEPSAQSDNRWRLLAAELCRAQGDFAAAVRWLEMMLADPSIEGAQRERLLGMSAEMYYSMNPPNFAKATEIFRGMVQRKPDDIAALNNLAALMSLPLSPSKPEEALVYSQKAYDLMQQRGYTDAAILDTHGWILVRCGRHEEGIGLLQLALNIQPLPDTYYHLGHAYLNKEMGEEAERALRQAKEMIDRAERDKQPVDPTLRGRVEEALVRAGMLLQQKQSSASDGGIR